MRALVLLLAVCAACRASGTFACERDDQCRNGPAPGRCEPTGYCSFVDTTCPSGSRYDPYAGGGYAGDCVPVGGGLDGSDSGSARDIPHLPAAAEVAGTGDLELGSTTIDTMQLTIASGLPAGVTFDTTAQDPAGPELAVVHAHTVHVAAGARVVVTGSRPLVILADQIAIDGVLDASATLTTPGAGGFASALGPGAGGAGVHAGVDHDSGGGGGGFGTAGGAGGAAGTMPGCPSGAMAPAGAAGSIAGSDTLAVLEGGSGGNSGAMGACTASPGGAGGGALQLSAYASIAIGATGIVAAGGGGGAGGIYCGSGDAGAGSGGGAGGAIYLDAPSIMLTGVAAANGGGGGGGACGPGGSGTPGGDGGMTTAPAMGGAVGGSCGAPGGDGGAGSSAAQAGADNTCDGNGGGGGGAVGRIVAHTPMLVASGTTTPMFVQDQHGF